MTSMRSTWIIRNRLRLLAGELVLAGLVQRREPTPGSPTPFHFPVESARRLAGMHASGPVFAADQHGGYLRFAVPSLRPYIANNAD